MGRSVIEAPYYINTQGDLRFRYHEGQRRMMDSRRRFLLLLAGTQGGKTVSGPWWLLREIARCGPGDYMVVTPTYPLMQKKVIPELKALFKFRLGLGEYKAADRVFVLSPRGQEIIHGTIYPQTPTQIFFGHAQDPDSLESATAKAAWLDEAGQKKFRLGSWEALQRRLSIHEGRVLITTTPYTLGWLKSELHDAYFKGDKNIDLIQFESTMNPAFPQAEFDRMQAKMPRWKFNMMYRGIFERPAGMIYDCFDRTHTIPRFPIPDHWPRYLGMDFGGVNTAGVFLANEPGTQRYILYRTYHAGGRTAKQHADALMSEEPRLPVAYGGAPSEGQWRNEFTTSGLAVQQPLVSDVEVGISRAYALFKARADKRLDMPYLEIFDDQKDTLDEIESYSRELDDQGEPTEKIEDKNTYHRLDALRYIACAVAGQDHWIMT